MIKITVNEGECLREALVRMGFILACHVYLIEHIENGTIYLLDGVEYIFRLPMPGSLATLIPREYEKIQRYRNGIKTDKNCMKD